MKLEGLEQLDHVLAQAEQIILGSLEEKKTIQDLELYKALQKFRIKVHKRKMALKSPRKP
jgi:hypothetical protein